jgi:Ca2+-binding RTX toxin-like protein
VNPADPWNPVTQNVDFWKFTGLSVPASDFSTAIEGTGADVAAYMPTMLAHADTINGSAYDDYLLGYAGNDTINGNAGADGLEGGNGNDILNGGVGNDTMIGGVGDDTYIVDSSGDKVIEDASAGTDVIKSSVNIVIPANVENLNLTGTGAINGTGNALANVINGNGAANKLSGAAGNDVLRGAGGNDTLIGGSGNDTLDGGAGADQFLFNTTPNATTNHDNILAYSVADDTIALDQTIFTGLPTLGTLDASAFYAGTSAHDADDRIIYNSATGNIYYDADGNGSGAQVLFAHVTAGTGLTNADFLIVA